MSDNKNVLAVDDTAENLKLLGYILKDKYSLNFATNGSKALELVGKKKPDLILLDIMMPGMDGFEVCQALKSNPDTESIPVIFLTAKSDRSSVLRGLGMGAVDYLIKPFEKEDVLTRIEKILFPQTEPSGEKNSTPGTRDIFSENRLFCYDYCMTQLRDSLSEDLARFSEDLQKILKPFLMAKDYIKKIEELLITKKIRIAKEYVDNKSILKKLNDIQKIRVSSEMQDSFFSINEEITKTDRRLESIKNRIHVNCPVYEKEKIQLSQWLPDFLSSSGLEAELKMDISDAVLLEADPVLLRQIFLALFDNSLDMLESSCPSDYISMEVFVEENMIYVLYSDKGQPLSAQNRSMIFSEGFTTKVDRKGMGLTAVRAILKKQLGGDIQLVDSEENFQLKIRLSEIYQS